MKNVLYFNQNQFINKCDWKVLDKRQKDVEQHFLWDVKEFTFLIITKITYCKNIDVVSEVYICIVQTSGIVRPGSRILTVIKNPLIERQFKDSRAKNRRDIDFFLVTNDKTTVVIGYYRVTLRI